MKLFLLAGEESGVLYAEQLKARLHAAHPNWEIKGFSDYGFATADLAVMGFWPVLKRLGFFLRVARTLKRAIRAEHPAAVVTIDYPGLNLKLAACAKRQGIPAIHLVCPQVWAWHQGRIPKIAAALSKLLCFFPFEPALFGGTGLTARFIGHPLVDQFAALPPVPRTPGLVALLPGSRLGEIQRNLPRLLQAAAGFDYRIPAANERAYAAICALADPSRVTKGGARELLRTATCAAVASGTATLEAALAGCPTVLVYAVSPILAAFARRVIKGVRHIGLANVIAEKAGLTPPMPELLQEDFTPARVRHYLTMWRADAAACAAAAADLQRITARLKSTGDALDVAVREIVACVR